VSAAASAEETRWLLGQAGEYEFIRAVVGWADLADPRLGALLDEYQRHAKFRGLCWSGGDELPAGLAELERRGLTLDLHPDLACVTSVAERFGALRVAIDHLGRPSFAPMPFDQWARALETAAQAPNVFGKLSGLINDTPTQWRAARFQPYARHTLEVLGRERVMFGSDWPRYLPEGTWKEALAAFTQAVGAQTLETREHLLGATACRFYSIETGVAA
jgi:L-fuconolactonase